MLIIKEITIDLTEREILNPVEAVQNDANTRAVKVMLFNGGVAWAPPSGAVPSVAFKKPDGTSGWYDTLPDGTAACTVTDNAVTAIFAPQLLTAAGKVKAAVVFQDAKLNQLATFVFTVDVQANPAAGSSISNDYYKYSTMEEIDAAMDTWLTETEAEKNDFLAKAEEALTTIREVVTEAEDAPAILCEASGKVIAVSDASDRLLHGLTLYGKTTQDGTPTPASPVDLVSVGNGGTINTTVAGKNLLVITNSWATDNGDGTYTIAAASASAGIARALTGKIPAGTYTFSYLQGYSTAFVMFNSSDYTHAIQAGSSYTFTYDGKSFLQIITANVPAGTTATYKVQLELGSYATEWEPYKGQTLTASTPNGLPGIPVSGGGNYTDENGQQWICDEVDFARGVYVQRVYEESFAISSFTKYTTFTNVVRYGVLVKHKSNGAKTALCSIMGQDKYIYSIEDREHWYVDSGLQIFVLNENTTAFEANESVTAVYNLATPIETALSDEELAAFAALHSNKPNTTAYNDAGTGMRLTYAANTKNYIDNKFTELQNAVLSAGANI